MYSLDFETMMQVMREHQKTGFLYADVSSKIANMREPCYIEIVITEGAVISCAIVGNSGQRLTGKEAVRELSRLGQLRWTFTLNEKVAVPPTPPVQEEVFLPSRTVYLEQWQMSDWSRMHRMVFALADGTKSITKIAEVLSASPSVISKILQDLQSINVVAMMPQNGKHHT